MFLPSTWHCTHIPQKLQDKFLEEHRQGEQRQRTQALWSVTWQAVALEGEVTGLMAGAPVHAGWRGAGHVHALAAVSCVARLALAPVGTGQIDTGPTVLAQAWRGTFIHIYLTLLASVASQAGAGELISRHSACTSIGTRLRCTGINPLTFLSCRKSRQSNKMLFL